MARGPGRWWPYWPDWDGDPRSGAGVLDKPAQVTVGERRDRVLYGPDGAELVRLVDRPFLGYRRP